MAVANRNGAKLGDDKQLLVSEAIDVEMTDVRARPDPALFARDGFSEKSGESMAYVVADMPERLGQ